MKKERPIIVYIAFKTEVAYYRRTMHQSYYKLINIAYK